MTASEARGFALVRRGLRAAVVAAVAGLSVLGPCSAARAEPVPVLDIDPSQPGARLQVNFPSDAYGDADRLLYRVNGSKDIEVDLQVFAGKDEVGFPIELGAAVLVDGKQARFSVDGRLPAKTGKLGLPSPGVVTRAKLSLDGKHLAAGVHSVDLLLFRSDGVPFPCWSFLVVKGTPRAPRPTAKTDFIVAAGGARPAADFSLASDPRPLFGPVRKASPRELESVTLRARLERAAGSEVRLELAVAALLDDTQIPFDEGHAPAVSLEHGHKASAELTLRPLPRTSAGHRLLFVLWRRPLLTEREGFLEARFWPTKQIGGLKW
ncbi:MAG TPA: hypothetical protein VFZ53_10955 [Polyangiaceae bacterium]